MAALDWSQCPAMESISGKVSGVWVFKGTRTPAAVVFENLQDGMTIDEVVEQFPVTREQVRAVLEFAAGVSTRRCTAVLFDNAERCRGFLPTQTIDRLGPRPVLVVLGFSD